MVLLWRAILGCLSAVRIFASNITYAVSNVGTGATLKMATDDTCSVASWRIRSHPLGLPCLKIVTGNEDANDGHLEVWVDSGNGAERVAGGSFLEGSVVLDKCYWDDIVSVKMQNSDSNGWAGTVSYSSDGGSTYAAMTCVLGCHGPSNSGAKIVLDGNDNGGTQADTRCLNGAKCTLVKRLLYCLKIVTGGAQSSDGYLTASVDSGNGAVEEASGRFALNEVVLDKCYGREILSVQVRGTNSDAWIGAITQSSDGGNSYAPMECSDCVSASTSRTNTSASIVVDGDASVSAVDTRCLSGATCTLVKRPSYCVKIITGGLDANAGYLTVLVDVGAGAVQEASGHHALNSVSLDRCYETEIVSVHIQGTSEDGWAGAITYSYDGGRAYAPMECEDCTGPNNTNSAELVVVDGNADGVQSSDTWCLNGRTCTLRKRPLSCVKIVTGGESRNDGQLDVLIDFGSGAMLQATGHFAINKAVLDKCYDAEIASVQVRGTDENEWTGTVTYSSNGGVSYLAMTCSAGCTGTSRETTKLVVDLGDDSEVYASTRCFLGATCSMDVSQLGTTTSTTVYTLQTNNGSAAHDWPYLGHNGLALGMQTTATAGAKWKIERVNGSGNSSMCTLQAAAPQDTGERYLSSNGSTLQMVSTPATINEQWMIDGLC